jgi:NAD(P)-dependent dehydrogenase (short-subunit alcohol dehydrogenase family)
MAGRLQNEHIFVSGGAQGIGAAIVEKCLNEGAKVSFIDLDQAKAQERTTALGGVGLSFTRGDVRKAADIARAHEAAKAAFGPVTGLVNNAGRNSYADPVKMTEDQWDDVFAVDLKSAWLCARAMLPDMLAAKKGSIVNIASIHADLTYPGMFPYAAAKAGLVGMTRSLALEVGPQQIRVNALSPGYTETPLLKEWFGMQPPEKQREVLSVHAMGRMAKPMEIANCAAFLLSDEASFVTGANWRADGGLGARFA